MRLFVCESSVPQTIFYAVEDEGLVESERKGALENRKGAEKKKIQTQTLNLNILQATILAFNWNVF